MVNTPRVRNSVNKSYLKDTRRQILINSTKRQSLPSITKKITPAPVHYFVGLLTKKNTIQEHSETTIIIDCTSSIGILAKMPKAVPGTDIITTTTLSNFYDVDDENGSLTWCFTCRRLLRELRNLLQRCPRESTQIGSL